MRPQDHQTVEWLAHRALANGGRQVSAFRTEWDIAKRCSRPVERELHGRSQPTHGRDIVVGPGMPGRSNLVALKLRCRRCSACLRYRASSWRLRAHAEVMSAARTWMGTLTLSPDAHFQFLSRARERWLNRGNGDLDRASPEVQFAERHRAIGIELTKLLKRLREAHKGKLRFLLVVEAHKSGLPHYHLLVHQCSSMPLRYAELKRLWPFGFSKWKLCDAKAAAYVCKYLTKTALARVRASIGYGEALAAETHHALSQGTGSGAVIISTPPENGTFEGPAIGKVFEDGNRLSPLEQTVRFEKQVCRYIEIGEDGLSIADPGQSKLAIPIQPQAATHSVWSEGAKGRVLWEPEPR